MTENFSSRLRAETMTAHKAAETETFIVDLMGGRLSTEAYAALLEQYSLFYPVLESTAREFADDPVVAPFLSEHLDRSAAIEADLDALLGADRPAPVPTRAVEQINERLRAGISPERLVAHHYLRYLGDLSGGLAIARLVSRHYGIAPEALNMYTFEGIEQPKLFKDAYRDALDTTPMTAEQQDALIDEASIAYQLNREMFAELGESYAPEPATA